MIKFRTKYQTISYHFEFRKKMTWRCRLFLSYFCNIKENYIISRNSDSSDDSTDDTEKVPVIATTSLYSSLADSELYIKPATRRRELRKTQGKQQQVLTVKIIKRYSKWRCNNPCWTLKDVDIPGSSDSFDDSTDDTEIEEVSLIATTSWL